MVTSLVSLDLETTGLSIYMDQITQVGVVLERVDNDGIILSTDTFASYVKCTKAISEGAKKVTGITEETLVNSCDFQQCFRDIISFLNTKCDKDDVRILVSYNGHRFDLPVLVAEVMRCGDGDPAAMLRRLKLDRSIDLLPTVKETYDYSKLPANKFGRASMKLGDVYRAVCGRSIIDAHDALADSKATLVVLHDDSLWPSLADTSRCIPAASLFNSCIDRIKSKTTKASTCSSHTIASFLGNKRKRDVL